jgi:hypothetical protein
MQYVSLFIVFLSHMGQEYLEKRRGSRRSGKGHWTEVLPSTVQTLGDALCSLGTSSQAGILSKKKKYLKKITG